MAAIALPLWAQQSRVYRDGNAWVEEVTGTLPAASELRINTDVGSVKVLGDGPRISYTVRKRCYASTEEDARRLFQQLRVSAGKKARGAAIAARLLGRPVSRFEAEFVVQVPHELENVDAQTRWGALSFSSLGGSVTGSTGDGAVRLDDIGGPIKISSGGGDIAGGNLGADVTLTTGAGNVHIESVAGFAKISVGGGKVFLGSARSANIDDAGGAIEVRKCLGNLRATSAGGNLLFGDVQGTVRADTAGGSVRLASAQGRVQVTTGGGSVELFRLQQGAQVETGAGPITVEFVGSRNTFNDSFLHTAVGDVTVLLPGDLPVTVHASSDMMRGQGIHSDLPGLTITTEGGNLGPKAMYAEGALNGGGPLLRVRTTIGQILLQRSR